MDDYKIKLGVDVDVSDIQAQINSKAKDALIPVKLEISNLGDIKKQIQSLGGIKGGINIPLTIDTNSAIKSAQQVGQKIGSSVAKSVRQSMNIDDVIDKQVTDLMKKFSVTGKKGSESFNAIRQALVECRNELNILKNSDIGIDAKVFDSSRAIDKVTDAIANQHRAVNVLGDDYVKLAEYMKKTNDPKKGYKIQVPDFIKQEQGDDYRSNRSSLGIAFTTGKGTSFVDFINQLNGDLGRTIDLTKGEAEAFDELLRKVEIGRQQLKALEQSEKSLNANSSTYEILGQNGINREEIYSNVMSIMNVIDNAEKQIAQASSKATNIITQNENEKQQAYKATTDAVVYHAGVVSKLNKAETNGRFYGSNRGTGYFGTGHYFVDSATKHELDNSPSYRNLPYTSIDISQYDNLFKVTNDEIGYALHSFLGNLTRFTQGSDNFDVDELFAQFKKVFGDTVMDIKEFGSRVDKLKTFMTNSDFYDRSDSVSTQFMKSLGYGGVDTRGTSLADTRYGTVIYDLKEESVLQANITDELQKQGQMLEKINYERGQVFDRETDARIQGQLDEEIKRKETIAEFEKSFDSTNLDFASESLDNAKNRIKELDKCINECQYSLNNLDEEYKDYVRDMSVRGLDEEDLRLVEDEDEWKNSRLEAYKDYINEASQEKERLQSEIPALEEVYTRESQLANEAYEQAKQVVEQRHKEAQQAQETANVVVQNEERKQQAYQDTSKLVSDSTQKAIDGVSSKSIDRAFRVNEDDSLAFKREMESLVSQWTDGKGELTDIKIGTATEYDENTERYIEKITRAQVTYNNELGETIKKTIAWRQVGTDGDTPLMGFVEVSGQYSKSLGKTKVQTDKFVKQQKKAVADLTNQINQLNRSAIDQNASRPIKKSGHLDALEGKYNEITSAIRKMGNASSSTFDEEASNVRTLIFEYKSLTKEFRNAENASSQMKGNDYESGRAIAKEKYEKLLADANGFSVDTSKLDIDSVTDVASLNKFTDALRVAKAELAKLKAEAASTKRETDSTNREKVLGIDVNDLRRSIEGLQKLSPEINGFKADIDDAEVTVKSLLNSLNNINTQSDFRVARKNFESFTKAAQEAGIAVTETQKKLAEKKTSDEEAKKVNQAYKEIYDIRKRIGSLEVDLIGAEAKNDAKAVKDVNDEITRLKTNLASLEKNNIGSKFTDEQKSDLRELRKQIQYNKKQAQNSVDYKADAQATKAEAKEVNDAYNEIYNLKKKIGALEVDLISAEDTKDAQNLISEIGRLKVSLAALDKDGISSKFTEKQKNSLKELENQIDFNKRQAENKVDATAIREINKEMSDFVKMAKQIGNLEIKIGTLEAQGGDVDYIADLKRQLAELENTYERSMSTFRQKLFGNTDILPFDDIVKFNDEIASVEQNVKNRLKEVNINIDNEHDARIVKEINNEISEFVRLQKQIENARFEIGKLEITGGSTNQIEELQRELKELEDTYDKLMQAFMKKISVNADVVPFNDVVSKLDNGIAEATRSAENRLEQFKAKWADTRAELARGIKADIELGSFENEIDTMRSKFNSLSDANDELRRSVEFVENAYKDMLKASKANTGDEVADRERLIEAEKKYAAALEKTNNLIKIQARADKKDTDKKRLADSKDALKLDMVNWLNKNTKAAREYGSEINKLIASLDKLDEVGVKGARRQFSNLTKEADSKGLSGLTVFGKLKSKAKEYMSYLSAAELFMYAEQALRSMFEQVKLIDSAMTELKKVTNETDASYNKFLSNAATRAKELGTTIDGLVSSTADFARLGYDFKEAQGLAEVANIYAVVGDDIEGVEGATESLISTMAAFKDEMNGMSDSDFAMRIIDSYNELGNKYAISSGGLGEALERSASSLAAANNSLHESAALITAANEVVQNPEKVGNAMKTVSMRIRSAKSEMEEMGEDTEGMVESTATLRAEIKALSGVDIMASATEFKSTYQILDELSKKWENLSDIAQATIIEKMAGRLFARICRNAYKEYI